MARGNTHGIHKACELGTGGREGECDVWNFLKSPFGLPFSASYCCLVSLPFLLWMYRRCNSLGCDTRSLQDLSNVSISFLYLFTYMFIFSLGKILRLLILLYRMGGCVFRWGAYGLVNMSFCLYVPNLVLYCHVQHRQDQVGFLFIPTKLLAIFMAPLELCDISTRPPFILKWWSWSFITTSRRKGICHYPVLIPLSNL